MSGRPHYNDPLWVEKAYCAGANPEIFEEDAHIETALAYCVMCPVRVDCLTFALSLPEVFGVWGGTTEPERRALKRGGSRASCPGCSNMMLFVDERTEVCVACGLSWLTQKRNRASV